MADLSQSATLTVKLEGGAAGGGRGGSSPPPSDGSPTAPNPDDGYGKPVRSSAFNYTGLPDDVKVSRYRPGMKPPPVRGGTPVKAAGKGGAGAAVGGAFAAATAAVNAFATAIRTAADISTAYSVAQAKVIANNDVMGAEAARTRASGQALGRIPILGPLLREMQNFRAAQMENFIREMAAWRQRIEKLAPFNPQLAGQVAKGRVAEMQRDIAESRGLGTEYQTLLREQQRLESAQARLALVERLKSIKDEISKTRIEASRTEGKLGIEMSNLSKTNQKLVDELRKAQRTPLEKMLAGLEKPDLSQREADKRTLDQLRDSQVGLPIFQGER